jgi:hypothetical protein
MPIFDSWGQRRAAPARQRRSVAIWWSANGRSGPYLALTAEIHGRATAERVIAELHQAGGVDVPREFVIMDRTAIGLSAVFLRLQAKVNWHRLFDELIAGFDVAALARRQTETLTRHQIPLPG